MMHWDLPPALTPENNLLLPRRMSTGARVLTALPRSFLLKNYPNPFNPSTTISFYLAEGAGKTKLIKIYNALGQLVAVFDVSDYAAGYHSIRFDGVDFSGKPLPSGLYFARLQVGDDVSTLRLLLQK